MRCKRSIPYINALLVAPVNRKKSLLQSFPRFVADDIVECLVNILERTVSMPTKRKRLTNQQRSAVLKIANSAGNIRSRRHQVYKQSGGFLGALIPLIASVLSNAF